MKISDIVKHKTAAAGGTPPPVVTIDPTGSVSDLLATLAEHHIGALVVVADGQVVGIVSERDVVRALHKRGRDALDGTVGEIMTTEVMSASMFDAVEDIATTMTEKRFRHMPVLDDGRLVGIVTIGDVVLSRIRELEHDRSQLEQYITG